MSGEYQLNQLNQGEVQRVREAPFRLLCNTFGHCVFVGGEGSTLPNLSMKNEQPQTTSKLNNSIITNTQKKQADYH